MATSRAGVPTVGLYYLSEDRVLMAVAVSSGADPFDVPRPLFQTQVHPGVSMPRTHYVPSRDGNRFLVRTRSGDTPPAITVVLNWPAIVEEVTMALATRASIDRTCLA